MSDDNRVQGYIDVWWEVVGENVALLRELAPEDWDRPTDLPGWSVRSIAAHLAHLESELAGNPQPQVDIPDAPHVKNPLGEFAEVGVVARAGWSNEQIIEEIESSAAKRRDALSGMMPLDPNAPGDGFAALIGWDFGTLLSNRAFDQWMHQQDIRRAVGRPGGLAGPGGGLTLGVFSKSLPYVVGKRVGAPSGTTVVLEVTGDHATTIAAGVGDDGRAVPLTPAPTDPTTCITVDFETFTLLSGGRKTADEATATVTGDKELGQAVLANLAVTP